MSRPKSNSGRKKNTGKKPRRPRPKTAKSKIKSRSVFYEPEALQQATELIEKDKIKPGLELLKDIDDKSLNDKNKLQYYRLQTYACTNLNKLIEGEKYARLGLELAPDDRDFHFALAYIYTSIDDYKKVVVHGRRFLELFHDQDKTSSGVTYLSSGHEHLIHNFLGLAYKGLNKSRDAEEQFQMAIKANPRESHPYLNLINVYRSQGRFAEATDLVDRGLERCSQIHELRMVKKALERRVTISACMMVKNEEELLPRCLQSIRPWVDEIVIVDTGSTDRTVAIAESYGAKIYHQEWKNDFSYHRNYSMSKASGDWIFIIDADEEFIADHTEELWPALNQTDYSLISVNVFNMNPQTGEYSSFLPSVRFIRRTSGIKYDGIVHNQLIFPKDEKIPRTNLRLNHYGYNLSPERMAQKLIRSKALLNKQLEEDPNNCFAHFNMAQLLRGFVGEDKKAHNEEILYHARRAVELSNTDPKDTLAIHLQGYHQQITSLFNLKQYPEAERLCREVLEIKPDYLDAILSLAHICAARFKMDEAEHYFREYLDLHEKYRPERETLNIILIYIHSRHVAHYGIGLIKQFQKQYDQAIENYLKALDFQDPYNDTYSRLASCYLDIGELETAGEYLEKDLSREIDYDLLNINLARYHGLRGEDDQAEKYLKKAVALAGNNPEVFERGGVYYANKGRLDEAIELFLRLVSIRPEYDHAHRLLAKACYDTGDYVSAAVYYENLARLTPDNAKVLNDLAGCHFRLANYKAAEKAYAEALAQNDNLAVAYRNLGLTKIQLGKYQEALTLLENYIETNPDDIEIVKALGSIRFQLSDFAAAITSFEQILQKSPADLETLFYISECYYHLGYPDSAAVGYKKILEIAPDFQPAQNRLTEIETIQSRS